MEFLVDMYDSDDWFDRYEIERNFDMLRTMQVQQAENIHRNCRSVNYYTPHSARTDDSASVTTVVRGLGRGADLDLRRKQMYQACPDLNREDELFRTGAFVHRNEYIEKNFSNSYYDPESEQLPTFTEPEPIHDDIKETADDDGHEDDVFVTPHFKVSKRNVAVNCFSKVQNMESENSGTGQQQEAVFCTGMKDADTKNTEPLPRGKKKKTKKFHPVSSEPVAAPDMLLSTGPVYYEDAVDFNFNDNDFPQLRN